MDVSFLGVLVFCAVIILILCTLVVILVYALAQSYKAQNAMALETFRVQQDTAITLSKLEQTVYRIEQQERIRVSVQDEFSERIGNLEQLIRDWLDVAQEYERVLRDHSLAEYKRVTQEMME